MPLVPGEMVKRSGVASEGEQSGTASTAAHAPSMQVCPSPHLGPPPQPSSHDSVGHDSAGSQGSHPLSENTSELASSLACEEPSCAMSASGMHAIDTTAGRAREPSRRMLHHTAAPWVPPHRSHSFRRLKPPSRAAVARAHVSNSFAIVSTVAARTTQRRSTSSSILVSILPRPISFPEVRRFTPPLRTGSKVGTSAAVGNRNVQPVGGIATAGNHEHIPWCRDRVVELARARLGPTARASERDPAWSEPLGTSRLFQWRRVMDYASEQGLEEVACGR